MRVHVGLGANLGEPVKQLSLALAAIGRLPATRVVKVSSLYRSAPMGYLEQPDFYNAVAAIDTGLGPEALMHALQAIEHAQGRTREFANAPRLIDLDLLLYADRTVDTPDLTIPHPRMTDRAFVLLPLAEIDPTCVVPGRGTTGAQVGSLLDRVLGQSIERLGALLPG